MIVAAPTVTASSPEKGGRAMGVFPPNEHSHSADEDARPDGNDDDGEGGGVLSAA